MNKGLFIKAVNKSMIADAPVRNTNVHFSIFLSPSSLSLTHFFLLSFNGL